MLGVLLALGVALLFVWLFLFLPAIAIITGGIFLLVIVYSLGVSIQQEIRDRRANR